MERTFTINARVYYEDTDAGGIVYHANYLKFCERVRTEWLRSLGFEQQCMLQRGKGFVLAKLQAAYKKPAHLDDLLTISCEPVKLRRVAVSFEQKITDAKGGLLFVMQCQIAFIDFKTGSLEPLPPEFLEALKNNYPNAGLLGGAA